MISKILKEYKPFNLKTLKVIRSVVNSLPKEIGNRKIDAHYYGTEYGSIYSDKRFLKYKDVHLNSPRFCQIGYKIVTTNKSFGFESEHLDMFYINFCLIEDDYILAIQTYVPGELKRTCIKPSEPEIWNKFTNGRLLDDDLNKQIKELNIMAYKVMEVNEFFAYLKNPVR
jgi:hypothetical protein